MEKESRVKRYLRLRKPLWLKRRIRSKRKRRMDEGCNCEKFAMEEEKDLVDEWCKPENLHGASVKKLKEIIGGGPETCEIRLRRFFAKELKELLKSEDYLKEVEENQKKRSLPCVYTPEIRKAREEMEMRYHEAVWKSDGFDLEDVKVKRPRVGGLESVYSLTEASYPKRIILYAKLGIHLYNMLQGKNLEFNSMVKYNFLSQALTRRMNFITCLAKDLDLDGLRLFQSGVAEHDENENDEMIVSCFIARLRSAEKPEKKPKEEEKPKKKEPVNCSSALPQWPSSENDFKDTSRYYLLKTSEVREYDCIRLYLELAFAKANPELGSEVDLTKLIITKVAVTREGQEPLRLETGNSTFFIKYNYSPKYCTSPRDGIAIIRRITNLQNNGCLTLLFRIVM